MSPGGASAASPATKGKGKGRGGPTKKRERRQSADDGRGRARQAAVADTEMLPDDVVMPKVAEEHPFWVNIASYVINNREIFLQRVGQCVGWWASTAATLRICPNARPGSLSHHRYFRDIANDDMQQLQQCIQATAVGPELMATPPRGRPYQACWPEKAHIAEAQAQAQVTHAQLWRRDASRVDILPPPLPPHWPPSTPRPHPPAQ
jgi:hypothetical protein